MRFERLGCFKYSHEENTHAHTLVDDVPSEVKQERVNQLMEIQARISWEKNQALVGKTLRCVIDRKEGNRFVGRTEYDSPDVDNEVWVDAREYYLKVGDFANLTIKAAQDFDLEAVPSQ